MRTATMLIPRSHEDVTTEDVSLGHQLQQALWMSGYPELQKLKIEIHGREVFLRGTVFSYFQKQLAQEIVKRFPEVAGLQNEIRVVPSVKGLTS